MAAAASAEPVSPELALVDAALAAHLRATDAPAPSRPTVAHLHLVWDEAAVEPVIPVVAPVAEFEDDDPFEEDDPIADLIADPVADLIVQGPELPVAEPTAVDAFEHDPIADLIADPVAAETDQQVETSWYPTLPAPVDGGSEGTDATETVLREIRDRLATPAPAKRRRRFRRGFTVASALSTAVALGVFGASVGFGVMHLPV